MKSNTRKILETVGILSVVASLLFVGMQLLLDRRIATSEQYQNRAESRKSDFRAMLESDGYMAYETERWESGIRPSWWTDELKVNAEREGLSSTSIVASILSDRMSLVHFDNLYYQYNQGMLDEEFWQGVLGLLETQMSTNPQVRAIWLNARLRRPIADLLEKLDEAAN